MKMFCRGNCQLPLQLVNSMRSDVKSAALPQIAVRNLQRTVPVSIADFEQFAAKALRACLRLRQRKPTDLTSLCEIFVWFVSDRRMAALPRRFLNQEGA